MGCRKYRNALTETVAGTLAPERRRKLDEHLAQCARCAARLDRLRRASELICDSISESAAAEPTHDWLRNVEQRLRAETAPTRRRVSSGVLVASAATVAFVVAAWALHGRFITPSPPPAQAPVTATVRPQTPAATATSEISARVKTPAIPPRTRSAASTRHRVRLARRRAPQPSKRFLALVKVQPEREAVIRLYDLLQSGKIDPQSLLKPTQGLNKSIVIAPLRIKPLKIPPIGAESNSSFVQAQSLGSGPLNGFGAGANKEKTP